MTQPHPNEVVSETTQKKADVYWDLTCREVVHMDECEKCLDEYNWAYCPSPNAKTKTGRTRGGKV